MAGVFRNVLKFSPKLPRIPDKYKGGRLEKIGTYFKNIIDDYKIVFIETGQEMKAKPIKSGVYLTLLGTACYLAKTNPDETSFQAELVYNTNELLQLSDAIRNPRAESHRQKVMLYNNAGQLRRLNLGICSLMWLDNYEKGVDVYNAHCGPLKVGWLDLKQRVVDIGVMNKWLILQDSMKDFDINPQEWGEEVDNVDTDWSLAIFKSRVLQRLPGWVSGRHTQPSVETARQ